MDYNQDTSANAPWLASVQAFGQLPSDQQAYYNQMGNQMGGMSGEQMYQQRGLLQNQNQNQNQTQPSQPNPGLVTPSLAMQHPSSVLGAQALEAIGLNPQGMVTINPTPGQTPTSPKSGVAAVSSPQYYQMGPGYSNYGSWSPQVQGLLKGASQVYQPAYTPTQATTPPPAPTPQAFGAQAGTATPFAQAPPAPGINVPPAPSAPFPGGGGAPGQNTLFGAHASALADAGKALYAHYGGDPGSATADDIAGFHGQLQAALAGGSPIKKMRSGGRVPGNGNGDTVPAMLTPGEYVMNKDAVNRVGVGKLQAMNRPQHFQSGGSVDDEEPSEARRKPITAGSTQPPAAPGASQPAPQQPAANAPSQSDSGTSQGPAWQNYAAMNARAGILPYNAATMPGVPAYNLGQNPNAGLPAGTSGYVTESGQAIGPTPGTAGALSPAGVSAITGGISDLASGLTKAAQTYADSIKPWTPQPSAIGKFGPAVAQSGPAATFTEPRTQNAENQPNPSEALYRLRMMGLA